MRCDRFREAVSARLDDEPLGMSPSGLDGHLAYCADCAAWAAEATRLTRLSRLDHRPVPDLTETIMSSVALPVRRVLRRRLALRVLLFLAGGAQLAIGIPSIAGDSMGMAMGMHAAHESASWNIALGAAFVAAAWAPRRAAGLVPLLATFLGVLSVLCVHDYVEGLVSGERVATHVIALVGLVLIVALDRAERALPPTRFSTERRQLGSGDGEGPSLRTVA